MHGRSVVSVSGVPLLFVEVRFLCVCSSMCDGSMQSINELSGVPKGQWFLFSHVLSELVSLGLLMDLPASASVLESGDGASESTTQC